MAADRLSSGAEAENLCPDPKAAGIKRDTGPDLGFQNLKAHLQRRVSFDKVIPPNSS